MSPSALNSPYASLDCAQAQKLLNQTWIDRELFRKAAVDCFFDGSVAASWAASLFLQRITDSENVAIFIAQVLQALPTAIPDQNVPALAQICTFLAASFTSQECREPLMAFCYAESTARMVALRATISLVERFGQTRPKQLQPILECLEPFFAEAMTAELEIHHRFMAIRGLVNVATLQSGAPRDSLVKFILRIANREVVSRNENAVGIDREEFDSFLITELASLALNGQSFALVLLRCLVTSLEQASVSTLRALFRAHHATILRTIPIISYDLFVFILVTIAGIKACRGDLSTCQDALEMATSALPERKAATAKLHTATASYTSAYCLAIASLSTACGADAQAQCAAKLSRAVMSSSAGPNPLAERTSHFSLPPELKKILHNAFVSAGKWNCPKTALCIGLFLKICVTWNDERCLYYWLQEDFTELLQRDAFSNSPNKVVADFGDNFQNSFRDTLSHPSSKETNALGSVSPEERPAQEWLLPLCATAVSLICMAHEHSQVRYAAARVLSQARDSQISLFFLPATIRRLQEEKIGAVSAFCIARLILTPSLLRTAETSTIVLSALLGLVRSPTGKDPGAAYQVGLVAIAEAAKTAPGPATSLLLSETERLKDSFGLIGPATKAGACAAIHNLCHARPARGTNFVPFISLCIGKENLENAPEAAALCFEAMHIMAEEGVLDAVKAVKIVTKSFPTAVEVNTVARKSYLHLLGAMSAHSKTKKGIVLVEKVVLELRKCIIALHPNEQTGHDQNDERFTWEQIDQAAHSLSRYESSEILRIEYSKEEPLSDKDQERERLENIELKCMEMLDELLDVCVLASKTGGNNERGLRQLLDRIAESEWKNRQRSSFDPDRIAALRATSEALRRARNAGKKPEHGNNAAAAVRDGNNEAAVEQFLRGVRGLPTGVIKGLCERCVVARERKYRCASVCDQSLARQIAMRVLTNARALPPGLPWSGLLEKVLSSVDNESNEKASALAVIREINVKSFEVSESRSKWFGATSPLFQGSVSTSTAPREMFVGMMTHFEADVAEMLVQNLRMVSIDTISILVEAMRDMTPSSEGFHGGTRGLLHCICTAPAQELASPLQTAVELRFAEICLSQLPNATVETFLEKVTPSPPTAYPSALIRLICHTGLYNPLRDAILRFLQSDSALSNNLIGTLGRALKRLPATQQRNIVFDVCGMRTGEAGLMLCAYCLGVDAVLPWAVEGLAAAECLVGEGEKEGVRRAVAKVSKLGDEIRREGDVLIERAI